MLTLDDCLRHYGLSDEDIDTIARHRNATLVEAMARGADFMERPWGNPALRQMAQENLERAAHHCDSEEVRRRRALLNCAHNQHPGGVDRRVQMR